MQNDIERMNCACGGPTHSVMGVLRCKNCGKLAGGDAFRPMPDLCAKGARCIDFACTAQHEVPKKKQRKRPARSLSNSRYRD